jgi:hypothetical protein
MKATTLGIVAGGLLCPISWAQAQISYSYLAANFAVTETDSTFGEELDGKAAEFIGYYELLEFVHIFGAYKAGELNDEPLETQTFRAGVGLDLDLTPNQSVYLDIAALTIDADSQTDLGTTSTDVDGYGASIGYRENNLTRLEFTASLDYVNYSDLDDTNTSISATLQYEINRRWRLEGGITFGGDDQSWRFGGRYYLRPRSSP